MLDMITTDTLSAEMVQEVPSAFTKELPAPGDIVTGTVVSLVERGAFIDLDDSSWRGLVHVSEISDTFISNIEEWLTPGDKVTAVVIRDEKKDRRVRLSLSIRRVARKQMITDADARLPDGRLLGGPFPQPMVRRAEPADASSADLAAFTPEESSVDKMLEMITTDTVSAEMVQEVLSPFTEELLAPGDIVTGTVVSLVERGAFIDLDDSSWRGLVHVSELSDTFISNIEEWLTPGDKVTAVVIRDEKKDRRDRLSLSIRRVARKQMITDADARLPDGRLLRGPFPQPVVRRAEPADASSADLAAFTPEESSVDNMLEMITTDTVSAEMVQEVLSPFTEELLAPGDIVTGTVVSLVEWGAFINLDDYGWTGLVHAFEIWDIFISNIEEWLTPGDKVTAVVIRDEKKDRRDRL
ncbi:unnamed protein product [Prorocentrum cordatum]|uniref:S1 motif domain-containing protein n=1 Tax=Prorocentrum cordatum TaxID=2364126 RepID=A0ABN9WS06_9DINO|nr:unnamed protein product [Polarella glacialis]